MKKNRIRKIQEKIKKFQKENEEINVKDFFLDELFDELEELINECEDDDGQTTNTVPPGGGGGTPPGGGTGGGNP